MSKTMQDKETKEENLYSDLQRRMLGKDVKQRMENKMQDSNSLREKIENTINVIQFEKGRDLTVAESITTGGMDRIMQIVASEISKAREEGRKEGDIASDFLYWHPLVGGMPDSSIRIGVEFEVGGCYEDWGFVIEQYGKTISSGRTLKEAISKLTTK